VEEGDECPSLGHLAGQGRERKRGHLMRKLVEEKWNLEFWKIGKGFGLWRKERNKGKGKRKINYNEKMFSWERR